MNKHSFSLLISIIALIILTSCQDVKKGLSGKKIDEGNEFLVIKKNPLVVPPDFDELPQPKNNKNLEKISNQNAIKENEFKKLLEKKEEKTKKNNTKINGNLEENILKKIKK